MSFTWLSGAVKYDEDERTQTWIADEFKPKKIDEETQFFKFYAPRIVGISVIF